MLAYLIQPPSLGTALFCPWHSWIVLILGPQCSKRSVSILNRFMFSECSFHWNAKEMLSPRGKKNKVLRALGRVIKLGKASELSYIWHNSQRMGHILTIIGQEYQVERKWIKTERCGHIHGILQMGWRLGQVLWNSGIEIEVGIMLWTILNASLRYFLFSFNRK